MNAMVSMSITRPALHIETRSSTSFGTCRAVETASGVIPVTVLMIGDGPPPKYADRAEHVIRRLPELLALLDLA